MLEQVRSFRARTKLDAFALAKPGQGLKGLTQEDNAPLCLLLFGNQIGQFLLGRVISLLVIGRIRHGGSVSKRDSHFKNNLSKCDNHSLGLSLF